VVSQNKAQRASDVIWAAKQYLPAATWQWDKACILAGALLATLHDVEVMEPADIPSGEFPYWVALDKHTEEGKVALGEVAKRLSSSYRQLIWASFYCESSRVNRLVTSPWWEAERTWRLRRAGLTPDAADELWSRARPLVRELLAEDAASLKQVVETSPSAHDVPIQERFV
jgi:hypothetical protein